MKMLWGWNDYPAESNNNENNIGAGTTSVVEQDPIMYTPGGPTDEGHPQEGQEFLVCPVCHSPLCGGCD